MFHMFQRIQLQVKLEENIYVWENKVLFELEVQNEVLKYDTGD